MFFLFAFSLARSKHFSRKFTQSIYFPFFFCWLLAVFDIKVNPNFKYYKKKIISKSTTFIMKKSIESKESVFIIKLCTSAVH